MIFRTDSPSGEPLPIEAEVGSFGDYALRFGYGRESVRSYQLWLTRFLKQREQSPGLDEKKFIEDYVIARKLSSASLVQGRAAMDLYCRFTRRPAPQWGEAVKRVAAAVRQVCSQDEVAQLLATLDTRSRTVALLLYGCGLRISETVGIRIGHLDLDRPCLFVQSSNGGRPRLIQLPTAAVSELRTLVTRARDCWSLHSMEPDWPGVAPHGSRCEDDFWVFFGRARRNQLHPHVHKTTIQHAMNRAVKELGLRTGVSCESLRHTFATQHLDSGTDIRAIQELLGHRHLATTLNYAHLPAPRPPSAPSPPDC